MNKLEALRILEAKLASIDREHGAELADIIEFAPPIIQLIPSELRRGERGCYHQAKRGQRAAAPNALFETTVSVQRASASNMSDLTSASVRPVRLGTRNE